MDEMTNHLQSLLSTDIPDLRAISEEFYNVYPKLEEHMKKDEAYHVASVHKPPILEKRKKLIEKLLSDVFRVYLKDKAEQVYFKLPLNNRKLVLNYFKVLMYLSHHVHKAIQAGRNESQLLEIYKNTNYYIIVVYDLESNVIIKDHIKDLRFVFYFENVNFQTVTPPKLVSIYRKNLRKRRLGANNNVELAPALSVQSIIGPESNFAGRTDALNRLLGQVPPFEPPGQDMLDSINKEFCPLHKALSKEIDALDKATQTVKNPDRKLNDMKRELDEIVYQVIAVHMPTLAKPIKDLGARSRQLVYNYIIHFFYLIDAIHRAIDEAGNEETLQNIHQEIDEYTQKISKMKKNALVKRYSGEIVQHFRFEKINLSLMLASDLILKYIQRRRPSKIPVAATTNRTGMPIAGTPRRTLPAGVLPPRQLFPAAGLSRQRTLYKSRVPVRTQSAWPDVQLERTEETDTLLTLILKARPGNKDDLWAICDAAHIHNTLQKQVTKDRDDQVTDVVRHRSDQLAALETAVVRAIFPQAQQFELMDVFQRKLIYLYIFILMHLVATIRRAKVPRRHSEALKKMEIFIEKITEMEKQTVVEKYHNEIRMQLGFGDIDIHKIKPELLMTKFCHLNDRKPSRQDFRQSDSRLVVPSSSPARPSVAVDRQQSRRVTPRRYVEKQTPAPPPNSPQRATPPTVRSSIDIKPLTEPLDHLISVASEPVANSEKLAINKEFCAIHRTLQELVNEDNKDAKLINNQSEAASARKEQLNTIEQKVISVNWPARDDAYRQLNNITSQTLLQKFFVQVIYAHCQVNVAADGTDDLRGLQRLYLKIEAHLKEIRALLPKEGVQENIQNVVQLFDAFRNVDFTKASAVSLISAEKIRRKLEQNVTAPVADVNQEDNVALQTLLTNLGMGHHVDIPSINKLFCTIHRALSCRVRNSWRAEEAMRMRLDLEILESQVIMANLPVHGEVYVTARGSDRRNIYDFIISLIFIKENVRLICEQQGNKVPLDMLETEINNRIARIIELKSKHIVQENFKTIVDIMQMGTIDFNQLSASALIAKLKSLISQENNASQQPTVFSPIVMRLPLDLHDRTLWNINMCVRCKSIRKQLAAGEGNILHLQQELHQLENKMLLFNAPELIRRFNQLNKADQEIIQRFLTTLVLMDSDLMECLTEEPIKGKLFKDIQVYIQEVQNTLSKLNDSLKELACEILDRFYIDLDDIPNATPESLLKIKYLHHQNNRQKWHLMLKHPQRSITANCLRNINKEFCREYKALAADQAQPIGTSQSYRMKLLEENIVAVNLQHRIRFLESCSSVGREHIYKIFAYCLLIEDLIYDCLETEQFEEHEIEFAHYITELRKRLQTIRDNFSESYDRFVDKEILDRFHFKDVKQETFTVHDAVRATKYVIENMGRHIVALNVSGN